MKNNNGIIRDSVNGVNKYCRIPIQRKRTPVCDSEISEIGKIQDGFQVDLNTLARIGCLISDLGFPYFAGKIFSYIDMKYGKEFRFIDFENANTEISGKEGNQNE